MATVMCNVIETYAIIEVVLVILDVIMNIEAR